MDGLGEGIDNILWLVICLEEMREWNLKYRCKILALNEGGGELAII